MYVFEDCQATNELDLLKEEADLTGLLIHWIIASIGLPWLHSCALLDVHVVHDGGQVLVDLDVQLQHQRIRPQQLRLLRDLYERPLVYELLLGFVLHDVESGLLLSRRFILAARRPLLVLRPRVPYPKSVQNDQYFRPLLRDQRKDRQVMEEQLLVDLQLVGLLHLVHLFLVSRWSRSPRRFES